MQGYEAIPELVRRSGSPVVFSMLASSNAPWIGQGVHTGAFRLVKTRHEETAASAAAAYSRATGSIGVCSAQRGPGFANSINALIAATTSHSPMLLIVAESPPTKVRRSHPDFAKSIDQRGFTRTVGAGFHHATGPADLEEAFWTALRDARWNGCPQVLSIGDGIIDAEVPLTDERPAPREPDFPLDPEAVAAAVDALEASERPLILAGQGAVIADCSDKLEHLALLVGARVANSFYATSFFAGHPHNLGICGTWSSTLAQEHFAQSDVVLGVGASLNGYTTIEGTVFGGAKIIHCEIDVNQGSQATSPELALLGDARETAKALIAEWERRGLPQREVRAPAPSADELRRAVLKVDLGHDPARGLDLRQVYAALDSKLPEDRIVVTDSGRHVAAMPSLLGARDARSWIPSRGYGSVGLGLGAAIGAAAAHPQRPVVLVCGDGGLMMAAQDLDAVRINDLDLTVVIVNDEQYGSEVKFLERFGLPGDAAHMDFPDVESLARTFRGTGVVVRTLAELDELELTYSGLTLVDVRVDPKVDGRESVG